MPPFLKATSESPRVGPHVDCITDQLRSRAWWSLLSLMTKLLVRSSNFARFRLRPSCSGCRTGDWGMASRTRQKISRNGAASWGLSSKHVWLIWTNMWLTILLQKIRLSFSTAKSSCTWTFIAKIITWFLHHPQFGEFARGGMVAGLTEKMLLFKTGNWLATTDLIRLTFWIDTIVTVTNTVVIFVDNIHDWEHCNGWYNEKCQWHNKKTWYESN